MKTVGIIGGIAPESTIVYYRSIISGYRQIIQDGSYPSILLNSIDMKKMLDLIGAKNYDKVIQYLLGEIEKLARAGADFGLLASNTPHIVFDDLQQKSPIPLISIVASACESCMKQGLKNIGLFGTRFTMQGHFYADIFSKSGISLVVPDPQEQDYIHNKYMGELVNGVFLPETRRQLLSIVDRLIEQKGIQGMLLGGTELPLILTDETYRDIPLLDTTKIHVEQILGKILE